MMVTPNMTVQHLHTKAHTSQLLVNSRYYHSRRSIHLRIVDLSGIYLQELALGMISVCKGKTSHNYTQYLHKRNNYSLVSIVGPNYKTSLNRSANKNLNQSKLILTMNKFYN
jgi:hypothetical protein